MKLAAIAIVAIVGVNAAERRVNGDLTHRDLRVETSAKMSVSDEIEANLRDDNLGASEDSWDHWENHFENPLPRSEPCSSGSSSANGDDEHGPTVGDLPAAAQDLLQTAESVATAALPFDAEQAESFLLPAGLVVAALFVVAIVAALIGVRRQQLSEPMFGPVELASDLPDPMTASAASEAGSACDDDNEEEDTGVTILVDSGEEEEEKEEEEADRSRSPA
ncbi:hypothetical protein PRIC2_007372 [Phytophthora ramorum]